MDAYLAAYARATPIPGFSVVVVQGGRTIFVKGYGVERAGEPKPMTARSSSALGSLTKSFTALAVLQLVEQGKVALDDPVVKYLPWFTTMDSEESARITVRSLLTNSSGIPSDLPGAWISELADDPQALERGVRALAGMPLQRSAGLGFEYSNMGFDTAGLIVEKVSGMPWAQYLQRFILDPLGMKRSTSLFSRFAALGVVYGHDPGIDRAVAAEPTFIPGMLPAGAELRTSAEDLGHYLAALLQGGMWQGRRIIGADSIRQMWTPAASFEYASEDLAPDERHWSYGMGWFISRVEGRTLVHHGGNRLTMSSYAVIDPARGAAAAILVNIDAVDQRRYVQPSAMVNNLLHILAGEPVTDFMRPRGPDRTANSWDLPAEDRARYLGEYRSAGGDERITLSSEAQGMVARFRGNGRSMMSLVDFATPATAYLRSVSGTITVSFRLNPAGMVTGLDLAGFGAFPKVPPESGRFRSLAFSGVSVCFPEGWKTRVERDGFTAESGELRLRGTLGPAEGVPAPGTDRLEVLSGRAWWESGAVPADGTPGIRLVSVRTIIGSRFLIIALQAPPEAITSAVRAVLLPLMRSVEEGQEKKP
jgi:CubicO group peptidase (beta-lactamase class C family)